MQAISCEVILTSVGSRSDGSLGLRIATPELDPSEKTAIFELQGVELDMTLKPKSNEPVTTKEVKGMLQNKTQSERIRGALFVWYKQLGEPGDWETFYRHETEKVLDQIKSHLKPV